MHRSQISYQCLLLGLFGITSHCDMKLSRVSVSETQYFYFPKSEVCKGHIPVTRGDTVTGSPQEDDRQVRNASGLVR